MSVQRAGEERRAGKRGPRRVRSGYSQAYRESSSSHAFRSDRRETVVDALAVLRARAIGQVVGLCYDIRSALLQRARLAIPEPHRAAGCRRQPPAVGREGHRPDPTGVALERL